MISKKLIYEILNGKRLKHTREIVHMPDSSTPLAVEEKTKWLSLVDRENGLKCSIKEGYFMMPGYLMIPRKLGTWWRLRD